VFAKPERPKKTRTHIAATFLLTTFFLPSLKHKHKQAHTKIEHPFPKSNLSEPTKKNHITRTQQTNKKKKHKLAKKKKRGKVID
jgi:hypothetical protein